jgi:hypothetical protein
VEGRLSRRGSISVVVGPFIAAIGGTTAAVSVGARAGAGRGLVCVVVVGFGFAAATPSSIFRLGKRRLRPQKIRFAEMRRVITSTCMQRIEGRGTKDLIL